MSSVDRKFSAAYSRLCHFVALRRDGASISDVQDSVVRAALYLLEDYRGTLSEIAETCRAFFTIALDPAEVESSLSRLRSSGQVESTGKDELVLAEKAVEVVRRRAAAAGETESEVKKEWLRELERELPEESRRLDSESLWRALQAYLSQMFARHGLQTLQVFGDGHARLRGGELPASDILESAVRKHLPAASLSVASELLRSFFRSSTEKRQRYLVELLDGTFSYYALTTDKESSRLLVAGLPHLRLLVDTNFVFGLLDLHSNPFVNVSKEVVRLTRELKLPFQLYYHPLTAEEFGATLSWYQKRLLPGKWKPALSKALLRTGGLSGVEARFHTLNSEGAIDIGEFFARYRNVEALLDAQGVKVLRSGKTEDPSSDELLDAISKYKSYLAPREKRFSVLFHDIAVLREVRAIRTRTNSAFRADTFLLTCDFSLWRYDRRLSLHESSPPSSLLPNVFLQLVRPFIPRTEDFDRSFVDTFALPEFRSATSAGVEAVSRVASVLRLYEDLPEAVAIRLLGNQALLNRVEEAHGAKGPELAILVDEAVAFEAKLAREEADRLASELSSERALKEADARSREEVLKAAQKDADTWKEEAKRLREILERPREEPFTVSVQASVPEVDDTLSVPPSQASAVEDRFKEYEARNLRLADIAWSLGYVVVGGLCWGLEYIVLLRYGNTVPAVALASSWTVFVVAAVFVQLAPWVKRRKDPGYFRILWLLLAVLSSLLIAAPSGRALLSPVTGAAFLALLVALRKDSRIDA